METKCSQNVVTLVRKLLNMYSKIWCIQVSEIFIKLLYSLLYHLFYTISWTSVTLGLEWSSVCVNVIDNLKLKPTPALQQLETIEDKNEVKSNPYFSQKTVIRKLMNSRNKVNCKKYTHIRMFLIKILFMKI